MADSQVTVAAAVATVNPTSDLSTTGVTYTVAMASGVFKDTSDIPFAGIDGNTYQFTVADTDAPEISTYSPGLGAVSVAASTDIVLTFTEPIQAGTGSIVFTPSSGISLCPYKPEP